MTFYTGAHVLPSAAETTEKRNIHPLIEEPIGTVCYVTAWLKGNNGSAAALHA